MISAQQLNTWYAADKPRAGGMRSIRINWTEERAVAAGYTPEDLRDALALAFKERLVQLTPHALPKDLTPAERDTAWTNRFGDIWYYWNPRD